MKAIITLRSMESVFQSIQQDKELDRMALYNEQFSETLDFPRIDKPNKVLVIASTGRCGSHMLGHALHSTGCFGFPLEYTNPDNLREWKRRLNISDTEEVLSELQRRRTSENGVFGIKVHYPHLKVFGGIEGLLTCFDDPYFIMLSRKDVLKQAVSYAIAKQTGVWIAGQPAECETPVYDFQLIDTCLRQTIKNTAAWRYALATHGCRFIELNFDKVKHELTSTIKKIAEFLSVDVAEDKIPIKQITKRQGNDLNVEWERRFLADFTSAQLYDSIPTQSSIASWIREHIAGPAMGR